MAGPVSAKNDPSKKILDGCRLRMPSFVLLMKNSKKQKGSEHDDTSKQHGNYSLHEFTWDSARH
jgi:hypothetical protein